MRPRQTVWSPGATLLKTRSALRTVPRGWSFSSWSCATLFGLKRRYPSLKTFVFFGVFFVQKTLLTRSTAGAGAAQYLSERSSPVVYFQGWGV